MKEEAVESAKGIIQNLIVVASLVHTLTDSFGSASDLYRKLKKERKASKDDNSDTEYHHKPLSRRKHRDSDSDSDFRNRRRLGHSKSRKGERSRSRRRRDPHDSDEDSINAASELVLAEYRRGHYYLGEKFAKGDIIAQNQLQSQIISLQSTLLAIYRDPRHNPVSTHLSHLLQTTRSARAAAVETLAMQYQRMLEIPEMFPLKDLPGAFPIPVHDIPDLAVRPEPQRAKSSVSGSHSLYCAYARDLQKFPDQPLADAYRADGDGRCPFCKFVSTRSGKAWEIVKEDQGDRKRQKVFLVHQRYIVKCHREGGGFACVICSRCRETDTVTQEAKGLVNHLWREHTCKELREDRDVVEMG